MFEETIDRSASPFAPTPEPWSGSVGEVSLTPFRKNSSTLCIRRPVPTRKHMWRGTSFADRLGELAVTCHGSRTLQDTLAKAAEEGDKRTLFEMAEKLCADPQLLIYLVEDKFANYFVQSLCEWVDDGLAVRILTIMLSAVASFGDLCVHQYGSHVVQGFIGRGQTQKFISIKLVEALSKDIPRIGTDFLGSICLVQAVKGLLTSCRLVAAIAPHTIELSLSRHGHLVVMETIAKASSQTLGLIEKTLADNLSLLLESEYGFRVVAHALDLEKNGKVNMKYSRVRLFAERLEFDQTHFKLINHIMTNFPTHPVVENDLIPRIIEIVKAGCVEQRE